ncbi:unnamed protein product [Citrullus colocynthis]|uniref:Uncharacterized protein n=1 Tax=Citrullus colocynthis TaxID=252529 RepID=A0ABP0Z980_9ROSI
MFAVNYSLVPNCLPSSSSSSRMLSRWESAANLCEWFKGPIVSNCSIHLRLPSTGKQHYVPLRGPLTRISTLVVHSTIDNFFIANFVVPRQICCGPFNLCCVLFLVVVDIFLGRS